MVPRASCRLGLLAAGCSLFGCTGLVSTATDGGGGQADAAEPDAAEAPDAMLADAMLTDAMLPDAAPPDPLVVAYTGSGATRGFAADQGPLQIGHQFEITRTGVVLRDLGVWDHGANGLARAHTLTLFALDQLGAGAHATAIAGGQVVVPAGTQAPLEDGFRFAALPAPLALAPGRYALIVYGMDAEDAYGDGGNLPLASTGVVHGKFVPYQFVDATSPSFPAGGDEGNTTSVSFRYQYPGAAPLRILPLGDSITWGAGGSDAGYRSALVARFAAVGRPVQLVGNGAENPGSLAADQRHHEGHSGWVISAGSSGRDGLAEHIATWLGPTGVRPDVILLMIGTNDVDLGYDLAHARDRLDALVTQIVARTPQARLVVAKITPIDDAATDARALTFNAAVAEVVAEHRAAGEDVRLADMHAALTLADLHDKLHPNNAGYAKLADRWFDAIMAP